MSIHRSGDLRVRRTHKLLQEALFRLMQEKPFQDIQITEITRRAEVSRPAFYLHFHSKEELLLSSVDVIFDEFHAEIVAKIAQDQTDLHRFCVMLFEYWGRYSETLELVIQAEIQDILIERLRQYVAVVMADLAVRSRRPIRAARMHEFMVDFVAGGAYMLLTQWILKKKPYPAEKMGLLFYELVLPSQNIDP